MGRETKDMESLGALLNRARLTPEQSAAGYALAVKEGEYQAQHVTFDAKGNSTIKVLGPFQSLEEAKALLAAK